MLNLLFPTVNSFLFLSPCSPRMSGFIMPHLHLSQDRNSKPGIAFTVFLYTYVQSPRPKALTSGSPPPIFQNSNTYSGSSPLSFLPWTYLFTKISGSKIFLSYSQCYLSSRKELKLEPIQQSQLSLASPWRNLTVLIVSTLHFRT